MEQEYGQPADTKVTLAEHDVDLLAEGGLHVLSALMGNPTTTKQLALRLGLNRARVQFIVDKLVQRGLICVYKEIHEAERAEIYYTLCTKDITLALGNQSLQTTQITVAQLIFASLQANVLQALTSTSAKRMTTLKLVQCRMNSTKARAFTAKLEALAKDFDDAEEATAEEEFALSLALYPVLDHQSSE